MCNIFIRHKCSDILSNNGEKYIYTAKTVSKKIIRIKRSAKAVDTSDLTSKTRNIKFPLNTNFSSHDTNPRKLKTSINKFNSKFIAENLNDVSLWTDDELCQNSVKKTTKNNENGSNNYPEKTNENLHSNTDNCEQNTANGPKIDGETRLNELNMQMLSKNLHDQVFINSGKKPDLSREKVSSLKRQLKSFGMEVDETVYMPDISIDLPSLEGETVEEHFYNIARAQSKPYLKIVEKILPEIPPVPEKWLMQEGWTRYAENLIFKN